MPAVDRGVDEDDDGLSRGARRRGGSSSSSAAAANSVDRDHDDNHGALASASTGRVKTSKDWFSLFTGDKSGRAQDLDGPSLYSKLDVSSRSHRSLHSDRDNSNTASRDDEMYDRGSFSSAASSRFASATTTATTSYGSRYFSSATAGYLSSGSSAAGPSYSRSFSSIIRSSGTYNSPYSSGRRFGRYRDDKDEEDALSPTARRRQIATAHINRQREEQDGAGNGRNGADTSDEESSSRRNKAKKPSTVLNGNVIRITKNGRGNNNASSSSEESEESEDETPPPPAKTPTPPPPPPPPEDPLDVEERMLKAQLALSFTLTMTDEENIRQRMMEIKKVKIKRSNQEIENGLVDKFEKESDQLTEHTRAKEEEEKILINRLSAESLREVEQKDIQVRLQEIFRDRKAALEVTQKHMETHYEHLLQENSTEMCELDGSIRNKQAQLDKLQEELLAMTVRKELLTSGMEKINKRHQEQMEGITSQRSDIDTKISQYAVLATAPCNRRGAQGAGLDSEEIRQLEQELECPVCMDISRPPIYQCEEGHIICSNCKPLLTQCPHCSKKYNNPVIRCRFAEKLADRYIKIVEETDGTKEEEKADKKEMTKNGSSFKDLEGIDLMS